MTHKFSFLNKFEFEFFIYNFKFQFYKLTKIIKKMD